MATIGEVLDEQQPNTDKLLDTLIDAQYTLLTAAERIADAVAVMRQRREEDEAATTAWENAGGGEMHHDVDPRRERLEPLRLAAIRTQDVMFDSEFDVINTVRDIHELIDSFDQAEEAWQQAEENE